MRRGFSFGGNASSDTVHAEPRSIPRLERTGRRVPRTRKRIAKRRSGITQAGGIWTVKPGNGGPPDDQVKCRGPGKIDGTGHSNASGSDTDDRASELGADVLHRRAVQESGLGVVMARPRGVPRRHRWTDGSGRLTRARDQEQW